MPLCLAVDDSPLIRSIHRHMLERMGLTVTEADDGEAALAQCMGIMPDLVLLDWNMPVLSAVGFAVTFPTPSDPLAAGP